MDILSCFNPSAASVFVLGQCMGAAMTMRAFGLASSRSSTPSPFANAFVFHNATIGTWVPVFEEAVASSKAKVMAWHEVDPDHMREAVCYKNFTRLQRIYPKSVQYFDNDLLRSDNPNSNLVLPTEVRTDASILSSPLPALTLFLTLSIQQPPSRLALRVAAIGSPTTTSALEDRR